MGNMQAMREFDKRFALWAVLLVLLLGMPVTAGFSHAGWESAQLAGWIGACACILLCGAVVRPRAGTPSKLLALRWHSFIGWGTLVAVAVHVGGLVLADRTVLEYLRLSMPLFQWAGVAACILLLAITMTAIGGARRALWKSHRGFQAVHIVSSCALLVALAVHIVTTDRYAGGGLRRTVYLGAVAGALLMLLRPRFVPSLQPSLSDGAASWRRLLVFGRNAPLIVAAIVSTLALSSVLWVSAARGALREPLVPRTESLALDFPHGKHVQVNCLTCHHNFADGTGMENCVLCHKSERADLKLGVQARFHGFCLECHRRPQTTLHGTGPISACKDCHHVEGMASR